MRENRFLPTPSSLLARPGQPLLHRDLSWLQFNQRVLSQARSTRNPLLERVRFLSITASNLDEFFMIRFPSTRRDASGAARDATRTRAGRVVEAILEAVALFHAKQRETFDLLEAELEPIGLSLVREARPGSAAFERGRVLFEDRIAPALAVRDDFAPERLAELENLQIAAVACDGVWLPVPRSLPPVHVVEEPGRVWIFFLDRLLEAHLAPTLGQPGPASLVRVTRDADFSLDLGEEDTASIPDRVRSSVREREQGRPVRLEVSAHAPPELVPAVLRGLRIPEGHAFANRTSLVLGALAPALAQLPEERRADARLFHPPFTGFVPEPFASTRTIFAQLQREDLLLHHPYDSFDGLLNWIRAACEDPDVTAIEQTIYRTDATPALFDALEAVARRKRVRVVIEPRARFDELNNLRLTTKLRAAGVEVGFGFGRLKLHAKIALVTRREGAGERLYTHLSTGNYNASTARVYEDFAILTANPELGRDARHFFDSVWKGRIPGQFRRLVPAPASLHRRLLALIEAETRAARAGRPARIFAKVNALVDPALIEQLYRASQAGVRVDLVVRGACALIPGVRGLSENVRVVSLVDRYLEHSRIYAFTAAEAMYLSSADWMPRNFFSRLELAFPVLDPNLRRFLAEVVIPAYLSDTAKARELAPEGTWKKCTRGMEAVPAAAREGTRFATGPMRCQFFFEDLARKLYRGTPLQFRFSPRAAPASSV